MSKLKVTVVLFHDDEAGGYSVIIPTVPQLATMGETVEHAFVMAKECLEISLEEPADWEYYNLDHVYAGHVAVGAVEISVPSHPEHTESTEDTAALPLGGGDCPIAKKKVTVVLLFNDNSGGYTAITPTFPHCATQEDSVDKALLSVKETLEFNLQEPDDWDLFDLDCAYSEHVVVGTVEVDVPSLPAPIPPEEEMSTPSTEDAGGEL
jgi:predicted RNase H-like HicB family nuclease